MLFDEEGKAAARIAPAIGGAAWATLTLNEWVAILTIAYVSLQIGLLLPRYYALVNKFYIGMMVFIRKVLHGRS